MGSCMSSNNNNGSAVVDGSVPQGSPSKQKRTKTKAFQGTGHRLGSAHEAASEQRNQSQTQTQSQTRTRTRTRDDDSLPAPRVDASLTQTERDHQRDHQREARLAAAEQRLKKAGAKQPPNNNNKKKKEAASRKGQPLRGPNTQNTMRWTAS